MVEMVTLAHVTHVESSLFFLSLFLHFMSASNVEWFVIARCEIHVAVAQDDNAKAIKIKQSNFTMGQPSVQQHQAASVAEQSCQSQLWNCAASVLLLLAESAWGGGRSKGTVSRLEKVEAESADFHAG